MLYEANTDTGVILHSCMILIITHKDDCGENNCCDTDNYIPCFVVII